MPRALNDPLDENGLLTALAAILIPNTRLQALKGSVYVNDRTDLEMGRALTPVCMLETHRSTMGRIAWRTWRNRIWVSLTYLDRWDTQTLSFSQIRQQIRDDVQRMLANLQDTGGAVIYNNERPAVRVADVRMVGYGSYNDKNSPIQMISYQVTIEFELPPYVSAL